MATLKFKDENGVWQYAPSLKYKDENGVWQTKRSLKYKDANGTWRWVRICGSRTSSDDDYPTIGTLTVGSSVYLNENGIPTEYLVVHKGLPDATLYDANCDGVWLLRKDLCEKRAWNDTSNNNYNESTIHEYLNGTYIGLFDSEIQALIKQVKVPYGIGGTNTVKSGANGVSTKVFLPSSAEVGLYSPSDYPVDGACWSYFNDASDSLRVARLNGTITYWWVRSPSVSNNNVWAIMGTGTTKYSYSAVAVYGVRPALILPYTAKLDSKTNIIIG